MSTNVSLKALFYDCDWYFNVGNQEKFWQTCLQMEPHTFVAVSNLNAIVTTY